MSFPPLYKDIGKNTNDLINKGFISTDKYLTKIEADISTDSQIQFLPSLTQVSTLDPCDGELKAKAKAFNTTFTTSTNLKNELLFEAAYNEPFRGLIKPTFTLNTNSDNAVERARFKTNAEVRVNNANFTALLELPVARFLQEVSFKPAPAKATLSGVVGRKDYGVSVGGEVEVVETGAVSSLNAVFAYTRPNLESTFFLKRRNNGTVVTVGTNFQRNLQFSVFPTATVGAEFSQDLVGPTSDKPPVLSLAFSAKPDNFSSFKARINNSGLLGFSTTQKIGVVSLTLGFDFNVFSHREPNSFKSGIKLAFTL